MGRPYCIFWECYSISGFFMSFTKAQAHRLEERRQAARTWGGRCTPSAISEANRRPGPEPSAATSALPWRWPI